MITITKLKRICLCTKEGDVGGERKGIRMAKMDELLEVLKTRELRKKEEDKKKNCLVWILAILGAVAVIAGIAYAVYRYMTPDYLDDFDDDFDDDFEDEDEESEEEAAEESKTEEAADTDAKADTEATEN